MSESLIQKQADVQGLSTAILLPSIDLFGSQVRRAVGPLTQVVGVGLFSRTVLTLQRAGIRQLIVLVGPEGEPLKQALEKGPRVTIPVRWMPIREFPLDDPRTWESLAAEVRGFCLLSGVGGVFSRQLIEQLRRDVQGGKAIVVASEGKARRSHAADRLPSFSSAVPGSGGSGAADLVVLPASMLSAVGQVNGEPGSVPVCRWLEHAATDGLVQVFTAGSDPAQWYQSVQDTADIRIAERRLFSSLKGEFEGFVDRFFNRKVSRWFTRVFLALRFSPNAITIVATVVGLIAAACFGLGSYQAGIGAALLCAAAIAGNVLSFTLVNKAQKIKQASKWNTPVHAAWSDFMLKNVASRDFSVIVLIFALLGKLHWFLWTAAIGSMVFAMIMVWVLRPSAISRA
jgi:hypothetical protein